MALYEVSDPVAQGIRTALSRPQSKQNDQELQRSAMLATSVRPLIVESVGEVEGPAKDRATRMLQLCDEIIEDFREAWGLPPG